MIITFLLLIIGVLSLMDWTNRAYIEGLEESLRWQR